jgi:hypothetical protein
MWSYIVGESVHVNNAGDLAPSAEFTSMDSTNLGQTYNLDFGPAEVPIQHRSLLQDCCPPRQFSIPFSSLEAVSVFGSLVPVSPPMIPRCFFRTHAIAIWTSVFCSSLSRCFIAFSQLPVHHGQLSLSHDEGGYSCSAKGCHDANALVCVSKGMMEEKGNSL